MPAPTVKKFRSKPAIFALDRDGFAKEVSEANLSASDALYWIQLPLAGAKKYLHKLGLMSAWVCDVLCAKETRPRTIIHDNALIGIFRGINVNPGKEPEDMVSVRVWIKDNLIITVQNQFLLTTHEIETCLLNGAGPQSANEFLEIYLRTLIDKSSDSVSLLDDQLDQVEDDDLDDTGIIDKREQLSDMRRRIILMRRYLLPQRDAINRISSDKLTWLNESDLHRLREVTDACTRILEDLEALRERANVIHEEIFALAQEAMNKKMYLLTVVAVIFMPLGFITGLLGINVGGIPGATFKYGFLSVCGLLIFIFLVQLLLLKRKRWF